MAEEQVRRNPDRPALPGYGRFAWMLFMQPVTLHDVLRECGIDQPDISGWQLWQQRREIDREANGEYLKRLLSIMGTPLLVALVFALLASATSRADPALSHMFYRVAFGVAGGVTGGVVIGVTLGVVGGVTLSVVVGVTLGVVVGVAGGVTGSAAIGMAGGVASGAAIGAAVGVTLGVAGGVASGFAVGVALGVVGGMAFGVVDGVTGGMASGVAISFGTISGIFRLFIYPLEALLQGVLHGLGRTNPQRTLRFSPILFHDLSFLPFPFLAAHIVAAAEPDPGLAARVIKACRRSPGQHPVGGRALAELQARELGALLLSRSFREVVELDGRWLPAKETDSPLLRALSDAARYLLAAREAASPHVAMQHLAAAERQLHGLENQIISSKEVLARFLPPTLAQFRVVLSDMQEKASQLAAQQLPNPFVTGNPLCQDMPWGTALFRGREETIAQVERLLADRCATASLALIGPRRCGKSSLLNMLRTMLPDTLVVLFDLQDNPASSPEGFYRALADQARRQAQADRQLDLPAWPERPPIEGLRVWLDSLEQFAAIPRILICIDEFERLESLFPGQRQELLQFMGLLRATIQHRRRVRLLVAGAAPFDELDSLWHDHFVNLREIRLGYLPEAETIGLLTLPFPEFPAGAIPTPVAEEVFRRTGGQPFLTQAYGWHLIDRLNQAKRREACPADVAAIEPTVLDEATYFFNNIWNDTPSAYRQVLAAVVRGEPYTPDVATRRWLGRRLLLNEAGQLPVPVLGRWIQERQ